MKKTLSLMAIAGLATLTLASCELAQGSNTSIVDSSVIIDGTTVSTKDAHTLAYQAATGLATLGNVATPNIKNRKQISEEAKLKIESLLPSVDLILSSDSNFDSVLEESDLADYAIKQTITFALLDSSESFTLYYNVISEKTEIEKDEDDDKDKIKRQDSAEVTPSSTLPEIETSSAVTPSNEETPETDPVPGGVGDQEINTKTKYEGIANFGEVSFPFVGKTEVESETEDGEVETETEMELRITTGENSYITVKQEIEVEGTEREEEYKYRVVENGELSLAFSYEFENEKEGQESEVKLVLDGVRYKFESFLKDGAAYIKVKIDGETSDDAKALYLKTVNVDEVTGESTIVYTLVE